jgi:lipopolysaccharide transport protein LptA
MHRTLYCPLLTVPIALLACAASLFAADQRVPVPGFTSGDTLTIRSTEARMDEQPDIIHFTGGFELQAKDWSLSSEQATLYGKLDDPETVIITGTPARILVNSEIQGRYSMVTGEARRIVYQRNSDSIRMEGNASLSRDGQTLNGGEIEYEIGKDLLSAGGNGGVHIKVDPEK